MKLAEFLVENQSWVAPVIEWGGAILLTLVVISPFFIIRHRIFRPTRWWHIVGAYVGSVLVYLVIWYLINVIDQWAIQNYFVTFELSGAYSGAILKEFLWLMIAYPLLVFYSSRLLFGSFNGKKHFIFTIIFSIVFAMLLWALAIYLTAMLAAYSLFLNFN